MSLINPCAVKEPGRPPGARYFSASRCLPRPIHRAVSNTSTFAATTLAQAREIVHQYQVIFSQEEEHRYGRGLEMPTVLGDGPTIERCVQATRETLEARIADLIERGERLPTPASSGLRTEQVNVRLTADEKMVLESAAKKQGFDGLSDFIRTTALGALR